MVWALQGHEARLGQACRRVRRLVHGDDRGRRLHGGEGPVLQERREGLPDPQVLSGGRRLGLPVGTQVRCAQGVCGEDAHRAHLQFEQQGGLHARGSGGAGQVGEGVPRGAQGGDRAHRGGGEGGRKGTRDAPRGPPEAVRDEQEGDRGEGRGAVQAPAVPEEDQGRRRREGRGLSAGRGNRGRRLVADRAGLGADEHSPTAGHSAAARGWCGRHMWRQWQPTRA
mmetsp:Transcript_5577/g.18910  ORF Transcript_5577/g.18910 Transcript_5577/m.18910 type:complete len:225 (+) Transcript_5577:201-875(+)